MKFIEYIRLGSCAICPYSSKKKDKSLMCNWEDNEKPEVCSEINDCGEFVSPKIDMSNIEID